MVTGRRQVRQGVVAERLQSHQLQQAADGGEQGAMEVVRDESQPRPRRSRSYSSRPRGQADYGRIGLGHEQDRRDR